MFELPWILVVMVDEIFSVVQGDSSILGLQSKAILVSFIL